MPFAKAKTVADLSPIVEYGEGRWPGTVGSPSEAAALATAIRRLIELGLRIKREKT